LTRTDIVRHRNRRIDDSLARNHGFTFGVTAQYVSFIIPHSFLGTNNELWCPFCALSFVATFCPFSLCDLCRQPIAAGESALIHTIFGNNGNIPASYVKVMRTPMHKRQSQASSVYGMSLTSIRTPDVPGAGAVASLVGLDEERHWSAHIFAPAFLLPGAGMARVASKLSSNAERLLQEAIHRGMEPALAQHMANTAAERYWGSSK
jgi:hypothetical protein